MTYFKLFKWQDFLSLVIALSPCVYFFSIADSNGKNYIALGALIGFLWVVITSIKQIRELELQVKELKKN